MFNVADICSILLNLAGNKVNNISVVYTPWQNLKKTPSMEVGQVGFYSQKMVSFFINMRSDFFTAAISRSDLIPSPSLAQVRTVKVEKRINDIVNRLNKTKVERTPDLKGT